MGGKSYKPTGLAYFIYIFCAVLGVKSAKYCKMGLNVLIRAESAALGN